ncbi:MAG: tripartite tricarboxylate transporter TctB family protein [Propionibacteriaceae bacterium]|nr:tripartite tricarboxylate transporter TctB family protein [Propionibacteriaceae bacterium]
MTDAEFSSGATSAAAPEDAPLDLTAPPAPTLEKTAAAVVLLFGVVMLAAGRAITLRNETGGIDPRWWPSAIAVGIIACGAWMAFNALTRRRGERDVDRVGSHGWVHVMATVAMTAVVLVLWQVGVSFLVLAPAYLIVLNWVYGLRNWKSLLLFPAIITAILYLVFQLLLKVPL